MIQLQLPRELLSNIRIESQTLTAQQPAVDACLPCPAELVIDQLLTIADVLTSPKKQFHRLLRTNPSLLILALAEYRQAKQEPAKNARELVRWCRENWPGVVSRQKLDNVPFPSVQTKKSKRILADYLRGRSQKRCCQTVDRWLKLHCRLNKTQRKRLTKYLVAKSFRLDGFKAKRIRRESTLSNIIPMWQPSLISGRVAEIKNMTMYLLQLSQRFDETLIGEKLAAMKQLAYGASHEINNPLANIATRAQSLLTEETHPERRNRLTTIYQQAMRAHEMISDLMLFAHPPETKKQQVKLRRLLLPMVHQLESSSDQKLVPKIRFVIGPSVDLIDVNPTQFLVVIDSMIQNAKEAIRDSGDAGNIEVRFEAVSRFDKLPASLQSLGISNWIRVSFLNNGQLVDKRVKRHMFDPFFSGREAGRGLGFGLSKSWRIAKQHGGELMFDAKCTDGTRFNLWLPQTQTCRARSVDAREIVVEPKVAPSAENLAG